MKYLPPKDFVADAAARVKEYSLNPDLDAFIPKMLDMMNWNQYAYNFSWLGRPIIQLPQDTVTFQELIWNVRPDLIVETGIAHGGSIIFTASMLALLEAFSLVEDPLVVGIDIDIRSHNRSAIEEHPASRWIRMIEGSSTDIDVINQVKNLSGNKSRVMVFLDSNHTHSHVLAELKAYAPLVTLGSYCIVLDTGIEDIHPTAIAPGRPWCKGNSPKSALQEFLKEYSGFIVDDFYDKKAWVTSASGGFLKRI